MSAIARSPNTERTPSRDQGRVLLVTDNPQMNAYGEALERAGFTVVGVTGGVAALASLQRTRPHVVVADENLKGIRAEELARMLYQTEERLPLILIGDSEATGARRGTALAAGAFDYISVPSELPLLMARTAQLVAIKQTMDRLRAEADRDYLTGLANRRRFRTALGQRSRALASLPCAVRAAPGGHRFSETN